MVPALRSSCWMVAMTVNSLEADNMAEVRSRTDSGSLSSRVSPKLKEKKFYITFKN